MNVKSILKVCPALIFMFLLSCGDDDDGSYSFKDQDLSGKIDGVSWTYADGYVEVDTHDDVDILDVTLTLEQDGNICTGFPEGDRVFFFVPNAVGIYKLYFKLSSFEGQTVTLLDDDQNPPLNIIATEGAIEILTITDTEVTGRIDARADKKSYVNGNFTVSFCAL